VPTVLELTASYENFLVPVLTPRPGVCEVCKTSVLPDFAFCYRCNEHRRLLSYTADVVAPIALSVKGEQWAHVLSSYKNSGHASVRESLAIQIGAVLWRWLDAHEKCLRNAAGASTFPLVVPIPSTGVRADHPLPGILRHVVKLTSDRTAEILMPNPRYQAGSREAADDRFLVSEKLRARAVLLVDDQWTSGGHAQSAASAVKAAGSGPVAILALGRHFDRALKRADYSEAAELYYRAARAQGWSWTNCCLRTEHAGH
jgi:predicted amidophosphoribosyltransferase